ncbi:MAG: hypothetical protein N2319_07340 [Candidatus Kapabacteria bacterium]|nr:hypothetical protein [Candidatus Kapabacteria bacterium]
MKIKIILLLLFISIGYLLAAEIFEYFRATSNGKVITIEWKATSETNISLYEIERSSSKQPFTRIASIEAKGYPNNYRYTDEEAFLRGDDLEKVLKNNNFTYRIKVIHKDNSFTYSNTVNVLHNVSSIRRTWGMIKELFK